jgi:uncharacterized Rossmann fold enzyme
MDFETWEPVYGAILRDFGYGRAGDERARDVLYELLADRETLDPQDIDTDIEGVTVAVAGAGPSLESDLGVVRSADAVVAASTAADRLLERDVGVNCLVTDLDKHPETVVSLSREDVPVIVHAHGDNVETVREVVPRADAGAVVPTTQAAPRSPVRNFGGFTDGDRAAFLADHLGAARLTFPGWDLDDPSVGPEKARKLRWAERLLYWLERRRGERFSLLDGRRERIDTAHLPP